MGWGWDVSSPFPHTTLNTNRKVSLHENRSEIRVFMEFTQTSGNTHAEERQVSEGRDFKHPTSAAGHWEMWEMMSPAPPAPRCHAVAEPAALRHVSRW